MPPYLPKYASFLFSFLGRGLCEFWEQFSTPVSDGLQSISSSAVWSCRTALSVTSSAVSSCLLVSHMQPWNSSHQLSLLRTCVMPMLDGAPNRSKPPRTSSHFTDKCVAPVATSATPLARFLAHHRKRAPSFCSDGCRRRKGQILHCVDWLIDCLLKAASRSADFHIAVCIDTQTPIWCLGHLLLAGKLQYNNKYSQAYFIREYTTAEIGC